LNNFQLIPYAKVNGEWTLPDNFVRAAFQQMQSEGRAETVFFEKTVSTDDEFLEVMQAKANVAVFVLRGAELMGVAWLNGFQSNYAFSHFCFMREASKSLSTVDMGKQIVSYWLSFPSVDVLLGIIPAFNPLAIRLALNVGYKKVGAIPKMMQGPKGRSAAVILYLTQDE
jgi:hypothetical protein